MMKTLSSGLGLLLLLWTVSPASAQVHSLFTDLESKINGQVGVSAVDIGSGQKIASRGDERFMMCSTFKALLAAQVLSRVDEGKENLDRKISYAKKDLLEYAPVTKEHLAKGMSVRDLNAAMVQWSDNTAANLLLASSGGPKGLTKYLRSLGDKVTRLDRIEPFLNKPEPGKHLDTTTPNAMVDTLRKLLFTNALSEKSREQLKSWLLGNKTGKTRLLAGVPTGWRVGDKTGTCSNDMMGDVGILLPPHGSPIVIATYVSTKDSSKSPSKVSTKEINEAAFAEAARIVIREFKVREKL